MSKRTREKELIDSVKEAGAILRGQQKLRSLTIIETDENGNRQVRVYQGEAVPEDWQNIA